MKPKVGYFAPVFQIEDVLGNPVDLKNFLGKKVYLCFLRNTNCPMCSLHIFKLLKVVDSLKSKNMEVLVFYESSKNMFQLSHFFREQVLKYNLPQIISDPTRQIYDLYGTELSAQKASYQTLMATPGRMDLLKEAVKLGFNSDGKEAGTNPDAIPADFLLDEKLVLRYAHYGKDTGDNIALDLVQSFAINPASIG